MKALSLIGIIIAVGIGIFIWQKQIEQIQNIDTNLSGSNIDKSDNNNGLPPQGLIDNINLPKNTLDYSGKGLIKFPSEIFDHPEVQVLNLSNNNLTGAIPAEIRHLNNLEELNLSNNKMTGLPAELGQLSRLRILNVSNNRLTGLPYELGNLKNLEIFNLSGNSYSQTDLDIIKNSLPQNVNIIIN